MLATKFEFHAGSLGHSYAAFCQQFAETLFDFFLLRRGSDDLQLYSSGTAIVPPWYS
ncbi:hypothetical protein TTRE_0000689501 [Trichuris trichiura]|uniref:Uncharacterized protein n=1 Tax=Trichuris trichiura TaxID=36087 RepID=A0A077ZFF9_TRITR|nr:hypothetical protein TTRE_0000689501 [Trichuris trichiura]